MPAFLRNGLFISEVVADNIGAGGIDTDGDGAINKADEFVELQNGGITAADLTGIQVWSATNGLLYSFGSGTVQAGSNAVVVGEYTGALPTGYYESSTNNTINFLPDGQGNANDTVFLVDTLSNEYVALSYGLPPSFALPAGFPNGYTSLGDETVTTGVTNGTSIFRDMAGALTTGPSETPMAAGADGVVHGTSGSDLIGATYSDAGGDTIDNNDAMLPGEAGDDDIVAAGAGNDTVFGNAANDEIYGGTGNDTLVGNAGMDSLYGGSGDDVLAAGNADGTLAGSDDLPGGVNYLDGGSGDDTLYGSDAWDTLIGGAGQDTLYGGGGNNVITGGDDNDIVYASDGIDDINTGDDQDVIYGGIGDSVDGGEGGTDFDTLDVTSQGVARILYSATNTEDGVIEFMDGNGGVVGTLTFSNIEDIDYIPCFTAGTLIETSDGAKPVEALQIGDMIKTRDHDLQPVRWIGTRHLSAKDLKYKPTLAPIVITAGSLGSGLPRQDLIVSPQHRLLMSGPLCQLYFEEPEVLAPAISLTHRDGIASRLTDGVTYIHVMFDRHELVQTFGTWSEGFQPGEAVLSDMENAQRAELFELFPELRDNPNAMPAARRTLRNYETQLVA